MEYNYYRLKRNVNDDAWEVVPIPEKELHSELYEYTIRIAENEAVNNHKDLNIDIFPYGKICDNFRIGGCTFDPHIKGHLYYGNNNRPALMDIKLNYIDANGKTDTLFYADDIGVNHPDAEKIIMLAMEAIIVVSECESRDDVLVIAELKQKSNPCNNIVEICQALRKTAVIIDKRISYSNDFRKIINDLSTERIKTVSDFIIRGIKII